MLSFLRNIVFPVTDHFVIEEIDHSRKVVVVEDKELGIQVKIPIGDKKLKKAQITEPYVVLLTFEDGSKEIKHILT